MTTITRIVLCALVVLTFGACDDALDDYWLEEQYTEGQYANDYNQGYDDGYDEGYAAAYNELGYDDLVEGEASEAYLEGYESGYSWGYDSGWSDAMYAGHGYGCYYGCEEGTYCIDGACESLFPQTYAVYFDNAYLTTTNEQGRAWDFPAGLPDPYISLRVDDALVCTTSVLTDTHNPYWYEECTFQLIEESMLSYTVYDSDPTESEPMMTCEFWLDNSALRSGNISCESENGAMVFAELFIASW